MLTILYYLIILILKRDKVMFFMEEEEILIYDRMVTPSFHPYDSDDSFHGCQPLYTSSLFFHKAAFWFWFEELNWVSEMKEEGEAEIDRLPMDLLAQIFVMITSFTDLAQ